MADPEIPNPNAILPTRPVQLEGEGEAKVPLAAQPFSSFMAAAPAAQAQQAPLISPFALMQGNTPTLVAPEAENALLEQIARTQSISSDMQDQLKTPNLKLKASTKYLLKNKLMEANENLYALNTKLGTTPPPEPATTLSGPLGKFISYLVHGQQMMEAAKTQLQVIKDKGSSVAPGDFLLVQLKMNKAQQLFEFSSILLSNAVSDIKQFMQIQL